MTLHKFLISISVAITTSVLIAESSHAQSIWDNRIDSQVDLFRDTRARKVGDLITVFINETTDVQNKDSRKLSKSTNADASLDTGYGGSGGSGNVSVDYSTDSNRDFNGDSSFNSDRNFSDRFTVVVLDIQPNGNLMIGGKREIKVEGDEKTLMLSGVVRALDVRVNNTVNSQMVYGLEMEYAGRGAENDYTKQGWLMRKISKLWPF